MIYKGKINEMFVIVRLYYNFNCKNINCKKVGYNVGCDIRNYKVLLMLIK